MTTEIELSTPEFKRNYDKKRTKISVSFNLESEGELYEYAKSLNFSVWAKARLEEDFEKSKA